MDYTNHHIIAENKKKQKKLYIQLEIRSMERGICPIAVFCFALKRSFFNI